ncbi:hypothetical protein C8J56DRAFT_776364 [Mycena floridula]|nr:hypothetical protein C8J56DRAFT_776364 [Mycena floridula]
MRSYTPSPAHARHEPINLKRAQTERPKDSTPWEHMASTYAWVVEQELLCMESKSAQWIMEQQIRIQSKAKAHRRREELLYAAEAEKWMRHQAEVRRREIEKENARAKMIRDEIRRIEERVHQRREAEKRRAAAERYQIMADLMDRERARNASRMTLETWRRYEDRWAALSASSGPLSFSDIPWPMVTSPVCVEQISPAEIRAFLYSTVHSPGLSREQRIKAAQLRWHPDRFSRILKRVSEANGKAAVEEGAGVVARCLNDLRSREKASL